MRANIEWRRYKNVWALLYALGSNLCVCWNCLSRSLPPCCKSLPGFDEKHIYAEIHGLSHFFSAFSATLFVLCTWFGAVQRTLHVQLVCCRAACEACTLSLCCLHLCACSAFRGCSQVCLAQVSRRVAGCVSPLALHKPREGGLPLVTLRDSNILQISGAVAAGSSDQVIPVCLCQ